MAYKDLYHNIAVVHLMDPANIDDNDDETTKILDTAGFGSAVLSVSVGALTGATTSHSLLPTLQESATTVGTDFKDVASTDIIGAFTLMDSTSEDQVTQVVGYKGSKRYLRVKMDFTGTDITAAYVSCVGILGDPETAPATGPAAITAT